MKSKLQEIEYRNKTYKLAFDLNVMEAIQDEYGSIDAWGKLVGYGGQENAARRWTCTQRK